MKRMMIAVACVVLMLAGAAPAVASADWSDNFNGGAQQTWAVADYGANSTHLFQNNRYELYTKKNPTTEGALVSYVAQSGTDYTMSARVQQIGTGDNFLAYLIGRADTTQMNAYVLGVSSLGGGGAAHLWLGKLAGGAYVPIADLTAQPAYDYTDCQVKFLIEGNTLSGKAWSTGSSEPAGWQITTTDNSYTSGYGGVMLATYSTLGWNEVQVAFDDVSMAVPEPAGLGLLGLALLAVRRRRS